MVKKIKSIFIKVRRKTDNPYIENSKIQSGLWRMTYPDLLQQQRLAKTQEDKDTVKDIIREKYQDKKLRIRLR